jgi:SAM-dependent methyltransferase
MRDLEDIRGMKYPDEFITRFFFKKGHHKRSGRVLELGCGSGNNLALYHNYGWSITGVDINENLLTDAAFNFENYGKFVRRDLSQGLPAFDALFDVFLAPSSLYYIPRAACLHCLRAVRPYLHASAEFFLRMRLQDDYRYGRGEETGPHSFILDTEETGEAGLLNVFYTEEELKAMVCETLGAEAYDLTVLHCRFDNLQNDRIVRNNSDLILWGQMTGI